VNPCLDCGREHRAGIDGIECDYWRGIERPLLGLTRDVQERFLIDAGRPHRVSDLKEEEG
jgi:hypothetical protein